MEVSQSCQVSSKILGFALFENMADMVEKITLEIYDIAPWHRPIQAQVSVRHLMPPMRRNAVAMDKEHASWHLLSIDVDAIFTVVGG